MKKWHFIIPALLVIAGLVYWTTLEDPVDVTLVKVERGLVEKTVANTRAGTVKACQRSKLSLPIGGQIENIYVREGDTVTENQLLISLWNRDRVAQVEQARAEIIATRKATESACITSKSDTREADRQTFLLSKKLISAERADLAKAKAQASHAACEGSKAREVQAQAMLTHAEAILAQTYLYAPFAGKVAEVTGEIGEFSTPSPPGVQTPPLIDLLTNTCHYISAPIDEVDASEINVGLPVRVSMDAFRDRVFPATVRRIATYVLDLEKQARTVEVEANLDPAENDRGLLVGYSADMEIIIESKSDVLRIPSELIVDERYVLIVNEGIIQQREIITGLSNWHFTEVVEGLEEGSAIISNIGTQGVTVGAAANVSR
jgi:HlyD family secretion protein